MTAPALDSGRATIEAAVTSSAVLSLRVARLLADICFSPADRQRSGVSLFLAELDRYTREVQSVGPNAAADLFSPQKGSKP